MAVSQVQQDDVGVLFRLTIVDQDGIVVDLSNASLKQFIFQKTDGTILTGTASFVTNGVDGKIQYSMQDGDLSVIGTWKYQAFVAVGSSSLYTTIGKFKVLKNLPI
jgi:hypothetical protein